jgi:prephenate dehydratase
VGDATSGAPADAVYQGAPGAFSEDAARMLVGHRARLRPCATLEDVLAALVAGEAGAAIVPVENTLAGPVPGSAALLARPDIRIVGECTMPVVQALIAAPGVDRACLRRVHSHPMALAQCRRFFARHPALDAVPAFDTAGAVRDTVASGARDTAAIAGVRAARLYGAVVLASGIQDSDDNRTRFVRLVRAEKTGRSFV